MKLLVSGGRNFCMNEKAILFLDELHEKYNFDELVNGMANGIDRDARYWAMDHNIPVKEFPAKWKEINVIGAVIKENKYGKYNAIAGLQRNWDMAWYCSEEDVACIFCGSSGTRHMLKVATDRGMQVINLMDMKDLIL